MTAPPPVLRPATPADAAAIAAVQIAATQAGYRGFVVDRYLDDLSISDYSHKWTDWLGQGIACCLAEQDGQIVGFCSYGPVRTPIPGQTGRIPLYTAEIYALYVTPSAWGRGIAQALMQAVGGLLKNAGHRSLVLWVLKGNVRAIRFYEKQAGQRIAKRPIDIGGTRTEDLAYGWRSFVWPGV
jgi:ribosomal protein S18 acetylase RimI-like enzyme